MKFAYKLIIGLIVLTGVFFLGYYASHLDVKKDDAKPRRDLDLEENEYEEEFLSEDLEIEIESVAQADRKPQLRKQNLKNNAETLETGKQNSFEKKKNTKKPHFAGGWNEEDEETPEGRVLPKIIKSKPEAHIGEKKEIEPKHAKNHVFRVKPLKPLKPDPTHRVVMMFTTLKRWKSCLCSSYRFKHLMLTAPSDMDVIFYVDTGTTGPEKGLVLQEWIQDGLDQNPRAEVRYWASREYSFKGKPKHLERFAGIHNPDPKHYALIWKGMPKVVFTEAVINSTYKYAWHMEDDVAWTGQWHTFFDKFKKTEEHVITTLSSTTMKSPNYWQWGWCASCRENPKDAELVLWPLVRMSRWYLEQMYNQLNYNAAHHESAGGTFCNLTPGCTKKYFSGSYLGVFDCGVQSVKYNDECCQFGFWYKNSLAMFDFRTPRPDHLFHPIKCIAKDPSEYGWVGNYLPLPAKEVTRMEMKKRMKLDRVAKAEEDP